MYANAKTLEACRAELQEVLEGWIVLGLRLGHEIPPIGRVKLETEVKGNLRLALPNSHQGDIGVELLVRILRQAGVSREEWEKE